MIGYALGKSTIPLHLHHDSVKSLLCNYLKVTQILSYREMIQTILMVTKSFTEHLPGLIQPSFPWIFQHFTNPCCGPRELWPLTLTLTRPCLVFRCLHPCYLPHKTAAPVSGIMCSAPWLLRAHSSSRCMLLRCCIELGIKIINIKPTALLLLWYYNPIKPT